MGTETQQINEYGQNIESNQVTIDFLAVPPVGALFLAGHMKARHSKIQNSSGSKEHRCYWGQTIVKWNYFGSNEYNGTVTSNN